MYNFLVDLIIPLSPLNPSRGIFGALSGLSIDMQALTDSR
jgi:hypothetical protein